MLAASYAAARGLPVRAVLPEFGRWPDAVAVEKRDAELVALADAAVVVMEGCEPGGLRLLELAKARGMPAHVIGGERPVKVKPVTDAEAREAETRRRGLPD
jgi:hypothetical protein